MNLQSLNPKSRDIFWRFVRGDTNAETFEEWLYRAHDVEIEIGEDSYLEAISVDFQNHKQVANFKALLTDNLPSPANCSCHAIPDKGSVGLGELHADSFDFLEREVGSLFWLHRIICKQCKTAWIVAEEGRVYDVWLLARGVTADLPEVRSYRGLLAAALNSGAMVQYVDPAHSWELPAAIQTLAEETPGITLTEITKLLPVDRSITRHHAVSVIARHKVRIDLER